MKQIDMYTDGSCLGNPGPGGWAAMLKYKDKVKWVSGGKPDTTNNRMELLAVICGLKLLKQPCEVNIYSDSKYLVDSINKGWIYNWDESRTNFDLWSKLLDLMKIHICHFNWVRGHNGHIENEKCDELARAEALKQQRNL